MMYMYCGLIAKLVKLLCIQQPLVIKLMLLLILQMKTSIKKYHELNLLKSLAYKNIWYMESKIAYDIINATAQFNAHTSLTILCST